MGRSIADRFGVTSKVKSIFQSCTGATSYNSVHHSEEHSRTVAIHYATLEIKEADGIHTITLNRPERRNALNPQLIAELTHALGESANCACGVVVLTGAGTAFCSGMDLENLKSLTDQRPEDQRADAESTMWMMRRLYELNKPTIAAVNGPAIAGGTGLATLCDFTLAAPTGQVRLHGGENRLYPRHRLRISTGDGWGKEGQEPAAFGQDPERRRSPGAGLVTEVVAEGELMARVECTGGTVAQEQSGIDERGQETARSFAKERLDRDLARAMRWNEKIRNSADFHEGLSAFLEKARSGVASASRNRVQLFRQKLPPRISVDSLSGYHFRVCQTKFVGEF